VSQLGILPASSGNLWPGIIMNIVESGRWGLLLWISRWS